MTFPLPIRTAGDTATEHVDDHNEIHGILGGGLPTGLTTSSSGHLANHNTIHTILNATEGQSLPTGIAAGATGHLSHHNTIHTLLNETPVVFGPSAGAAAVRSGAGARTVTSPGGGTSFSSSSGLQSAINANPSGTFICSTNTPTWTSTPNLGNGGATVIFPGTVGQCVIDGGGADRMGIRLGSGATVKGGTWQNFGTTTWGNGFITTSGTSNHVIEDVVVTDCYIDGISVQGSNTRISHVTAHANGVKGIGTGNTGTGQTDGMIMEYCEVYGNNTRNLAFGDDASGTKILFTANGTFRNNYVHDNKGFGLWLDTGNVNCILEQNVCEDNERSGLFYEASNHSIIRNNYVANNGRNTTIGGGPPGFTNNANVRISDSNCTSTRGSFTRNIVDHTLTQDANNGWLLILWDHSGTVGRSLQHWDITDNQFWLRGSSSARIGGLESNAGPNAFPVWTTGNVVFSGNEYHVASTSISYWQWENPGASGAIQGVSKTWAQWQAYFSGEVDRQSI